jgi:hypothetical protein
MKKKILTILFLFIISCGDEPMFKHTVWLVLLDMSGMEDTRAARKIYSENIIKVINAVNQGDRLVVSTITESSINEPELVVDWTSDVFLPTTPNELYQKSEKDKYDKEQKSKKDSIYNDLKLFLDSSQRITNRTDIISALHLSENVYSKSSLPIKKLVIFSDMEENSDKYKFPSEQLTLKRINQIIELEKSSIQGLPDLKNVNVFIVGAHSKTNEKYFLVRKFWMEFFKACGAMLNESNYNSTSLSLN